jgi:hypothetical protein
MRLRYAIILVVVLFHPMEGPEGIWFLVSPASTALCNRSSSLAPSANDRKESPLGYLIFSVLRSFESKCSSPCQGIISQTISPSEQKGVAYQHSYFPIGIRSLLEIILL